jgi:serine/threonine protein kinase
MFVSRGGQNGGAMWPDDASRSTEPVEAPRTGADSTTLFAPTPRMTSVGFVPSLPSDLPEKPVDPLGLSPGQTIDDFQVVAILGRGSFGVVYLAWQLSLGREIALKVAPCLGSEGRTLARLDHPHIVRVHSESVREGLRFLCMQYVPSVELAHLLHQLRDKSTAWTGQDLLSVVDGSLPLAAGFDPEQLVDRQRLSGLDHVSAVCWIVARLADAVGHAHRNGVLHRDLKPGNVLVSQYGRPMLVDFNLADFSSEAARGSGVFGGTLPYMSPEHLDAFNSECDVDQSVVTQKSDIYSLGVLLFEMLTGELPFVTPPATLKPSERVGRMAAERRTPERVWSHPQLLAEPALLGVLQRCLSPEPTDRWATADELSRALDGVQDLRQTLTEVQHSGPWPDWSRRHPFVVMTLVGLTPHILGSTVNIPYNRLRIVGDDRLDVFVDLVTIYNLIVYPACIALCYALIWPVFQDWRRRARGDVAIDAEETARIRRRVLTFPGWAIGVALIGWLPGAVWFPLGLHLSSVGPLTWREVLHFQISVALSGLIALTYSALGVLCLTAGILYPKVCTDPLAFRSQVADDVRSWRGILRFVPFLAGAIPLCGAVLLIGTSPFADGGEYRAFRWLTTALIVLGMGGFQVALWATGIANDAIQALLGRSSPDLRRRN